MESASLLPPSAAHVDLDDGDKAVLPPRPGRPRGLDDGLNPLLYMSDAEITQLGRAAALPPAASAVRKPPQCLPWLLAECSAPSSISSRSIGHTPPPTTAAAPEEEEEMEEEPGLLADLAPPPAAIASSIMRVNPRDEAAMASTTSALLAVERASPTARSPPGAAWGLESYGAMPSAGASTTSVPENNRAYMLHRSMPAVDTA